MKKKFAFLILHYNTIEDTKKCVNSIIERYGNNVEIVIVDNASPNNTGKELRKIYESTKNIHIILSEKNLGFANGNNLGFKYIKEKLKSDFIIMINNDTYLIQDNFCELIEKEYENSKFAIMGPRILMNENKICNYSDIPETLEYVQSKYKKLKIRKKLNELHLYWLLELKQKIKKKKMYIVDTTIRKEDVVLQGCALIFSKKYISLFDGIDERTFLYNEEQLLYWRLKDNDLLSVYNPYLFIYHNENSSTNSITKSKMYNKRKFIIENELMSTKILLNDLIERNKKC